jgi:WD repeat-containing protein 22
MGVKWNMAGTMLTALRRRLPPVLYSIQQTPALVEFEHPGYNNICTMKSHCFAGDKDQVRLKIVLNPCLSFLVLVQ